MNAPPTQPATEEITAVERAAILKMLASGWQPEVIARIPGHPEPVVLAVASRAGWPDEDAVRRAYHSAARDAERQRRERQPGALLPNGPPRPRRPGASSRTRAPADPPRTEPPPKPTPAPTPEQLPEQPLDLPVSDQPCEVCGITVTASYIARTGRARHGHHPPPEETT